MENIFVEFLPPWVETGIQPAFYDKESGSVLQQTARMYARVNMLIRMFNKLSKQTKETVENYIEQFNQLHDYVHDYFDNLDVQEEINNKLDAMVEAGTLQEIIADYLNSKAVFGFENVAEMVTSTNLIEGSYAETLGYYNNGDEGGALYHIEEMTNEITVDGGEYIAMDDITLVAHLVNIPEVNIKQFGAKGDDTTDDTTTINNAIIYAKKTKTALYIPKGTYLVTDSLEKLITGFKLSGRSKGDSIIRLDSDEGIKLFNLEGQSFVQINDIGIITDKYTQGQIYDEQSLQQIAIWTKNAYYCSFNRIMIKGFFEGFGSGYYSWCNTITECEVYYCTNGILGSGSETNAYSIISTSLEYCNQAIRLSSAFGNHIISSIIQRSNYGITLLGCRGTSIESNYFEANGCDLRVEDGEYPTGTTSFCNNYILVANNTNRIKISTNSSTSVCYIKNNTFRAKNNLDSCTILGYSNTTYKMYVAFNDNYLESPIVIGQEGNINVKVNHSNKGKNSATAWLSSTYTVSADATVETIPFANTHSTVNGDNLSISNNGIKVARACYVKIGGKLDFGNLTSGDKIVRISIDGTPVANTNTNKTAKGELVIPEFVYNVNANSVITLEVYAKASDTVVGSSNTRVTYLTVEEL